MWKNFLKLWKKVYLSRKKRCIVKIKDIKNIFLSVYSVKFDIRKLLKLVLPKMWKNLLKVWKNFPKSVDKLS